MADIITVFEYGYLACNLKALDDRCAGISKASFDYFESLCLREGSREDGSDAPTFLQLCSYNDARALQVRNYVGVIHTPSGQQIEVLPKISRAGGAPGASRQALLNMLRHLREFRHLETTDAAIATEQLPLFEVFVRQFLQSVNRLVKRGLRSEYIRQEANQRFMKGKLLTAMQLKHNLVNKHRFYVEYDEYLQDRPVNRLIHSALHKVAQYTRLNASQKLCRELIFAFSDVPRSRNIKQDFAAMKVTRGMEHYHRPLDWARLILEGSTPLSMQGKTEALSLLFPMEAVFEAYVASVLRKQLRPPLVLKEQARSKYLVHFNGARWFNLKPDILIQNRGEVALVMDTKWKLLDTRKANSSDKLGLSQADFYQMFAYGHKYLGRKGGDLVLIYPKTDQFSEAIPYSFDYDEQLRLWVVPFDIAAGVRDEGRLVLPDALAGSIF